MMISGNGKIAKFGNDNQDSFNFRLENDESFTGIYGGLRKLGQDTRITEIGFFISKQ